MEPQKTRILAIGRDPAIAEVVSRIIHAVPEWSGTSVTTDEAALAAFTEQPFDIVLFCNGILKTEEENLSTAFRQLNNRVMFIQHYGGGSGLLQNEIRAAMDKEKEG